MWELPTFTWLPCSLRTVASDRRREFRPVGKKKYEISPGGSSRRGGKGNTFVDELTAKIARTVSREEYSGETRLTPGQIAPYFARGDTNVFIGPNRALLASALRTLTRPLMP